MHENHFLKPFIIKSEFPQLAAITAQDMHSCTFCGRSALSIRFCHLSSKPFGGVTWLQTTEAKSSSLQQSCTKVFAVFSWSKIWLKKQFYETLHACFPLSFCAVRNSTQLKHICYKIQMYLFNSPNYLGCFSEGRCCWTELNQV